MSKYEPMTIFLVARDEDLKPAGEELMIHGHSALNDWSLLSSCQAAIRVPGRCDQCDDMARTIKTSGVVPIYFGVGTFLAQGQKLNDKRGVQLPAGPRVKNPAHHPFPVPPAASWQSPSWQAGIAQAEGLMPPGSSLNTQMAIMEALRDKTAPTCKACGGRGTVRRRRLAGGRPGQWVGASDQTENLRYEEVDVPCSDCLGKRGGPSPKTVIDKAIAESRAKHAANAGVPF